LLRLWGYSNVLKKNIYNLIFIYRLFGHEKRLLKINVKYANFENSKYFHKIRPKIIELFEFGEEIVKNVTSIIQRKFKSDNAYKICVHTRNGDFTGMGESRAEQVGPAIDRIIGHLPSITVIQLFYFINIFIYLFRMGKLEIIH
jgi:hypothetical protein